MQRKVVYTTRIRLKNGRVLYASQYGIKAFRFEVQRVVLQHNSNLHRLIVAQPNPKFYKEEKHNGKNYCQTG